MRKYEFKNPKPKKSRWKKSFKFLLLILITVFLVKGVVALGLLPFIQDKGAHLIQRTESLAVAQSAPSEPHGTAVRDGSPGAAFQLAGVNLFEKREAELNRREQELRMREETLRRMEEDVQKKFQELSALQKEIQDYHDERASQRTTRIRSLSRIYETMKPREAAKLLENMEEQLAVSIIATMNTDAAAGILAVMDTKKAAKISQILSAP